MPDADDEDRQHVVGDSIDNPVVTDAQAVAKTITQISVDLGRIDRLVHCAAIMPAPPVGCAVAIVPEPALPSRAGRDKQRLMQAQKDYERSVKEERESSRPAQGT